VLLLVVYAAAVWYALYAWRRSWRGLLIWLGAVGVLLFIAVLHYWSWLLSRGWIIQPPMRVMFYPYIALVGVAGLLFYLMPRSYASRPCPRCGYEVDGLIEEGKFTCPECGSAHAKGYPRGTRIERCFCCRANLRGSHAHPDVRCHRCSALHVIGAFERGLAKSAIRSPTDPAIQPAADQDQEGQTDQSHDPQHAQLPEGQGINQGNRGDTGAGQERVLTTEPEHRRIQ
jgi:DNA-directed RNA polymerase subunit RPC12/RpoP